MWKLRIEVRRVTGLGELRALEAVTDQGDRVVLLEVPAREPRVEPCADWGWVCAGDFASAAEGRWPPFRSR